MSPAGHFHCVPVGFARMPALQFSSQHLSLLHSYYVLSRLILYRLDSYFEMLYNADPIPKGWNYCRKWYKENVLEPRRGGIMKIYQIAYNIAPSGFCGLILQ